MAPVVPVVTDHCRPLEIYLLYLSKIKSIESLGINNESCNKMKAILFCKCFTNPPNDIIANKKWLPTVLGGAQIALLNTVNNKAYLKILIVSQIDMFYAIIYGHKIFGL